MGWGGAGRGANSNDCEKAWSSMNYSMLYGVGYAVCIEEARKRGKIQNNCLTIKLMAWKKKVIVICF
jgi:hypothetical protein